MAAAALAGRRELARQVLLGMAPGAGLAHPDHPRRSLVRQLALVLPGLPEGARSSLLGRGDTLHDFECTDWAEQWRLAAGAGLAWLPLTIPCLPASFTWRSCLQTPMKVCIATVGMLGVGGTLTCKHFGGQWQVQQGPL